MDRIRNGRGSKNPSHINKISIELKLKLAFLSPITNNQWYSLIDFELFPPLRVCPFKFNVPAERQSPRIGCAEMERVYFEPKAFPLSAFCVHYAM